jgi:uncharacterized protein
VNFDFVYLAKAAVVGVVAGLLSGAFGIGGGMVATPMSRLFLGLDPYLAIGTSLALVAPTAISGATRYVKEGMYSKFLSRACLVPAFIGTVIGSVVCESLNGHLLMMIVALLIALSGFDFATGVVSAVMSKYKKEDVKLTLAPVGRLTAIAALVGLITGFLSGLVGIGGGFILVPAFVYIFRAPIKEAIGTSLLTVAAVAIPGAIVHGVQDHVSLGVALAMVLGSIPGARIGASVSLRLKDSVLRRAFGVLLLLVSFVFGAKEIHSLLTSG